MAITNAQKAKLNKMNRASKDVSLGTFVQNTQNMFGASGSYAAVAGDASASRVVISTGLTAVNGFIAQVRRSGSMLNLNATAGSVSGTLVLLRDTTVTGSAIAAGDVVTWIAY